MEEDWDVYKENFIPLEQGRKVGDLRKFMSINPNPEDLKKREKTRNEFEELLRCDNEDSLIIWYDYINWVEQNYPEGGEEANLKKLIENCISELFKIEKYHQNEKFFKIFLRYVRYVNDPLELFNLMFSSNIFTTIALFYINWAKVYEKNLKKAEEIIQLGINRFAQPRIQLDLALKEVQTLLLDTDKNSSEEEEQDVRKPFIPLKVQKKKSGKALAPVERLANYDQKNYKLANQADLKSSNKQITIFNDENDTEFSSANHQEKIKKLPTNNQENDRKAGKWCDNKVKSKIRIDQPAVPKFEIFDNDEEAYTNCNTDLKPKESQTLKEKRLDRSPPLVVFEKLAPNQKFFCDLKKIYCGGTEFSFEEIRGIRLKIAKKKIEDKNTKEKLKKEVEELKNQISARDNLFNDVKQMKKKLELLIKQNSKTKINFSNEFNILDNENKPFEKKMENNDENLITDQGNKLDTLKNNLTKFDKNDEKQNHLTKSPPTKIVKEDLTIVRDLWNGSIEDENTSSIEKDLIHKPKPNDFSIFKDEEPDNRKFKHNKNDYKDDFFGETRTNNFQDTNTFALPQGDFDFVAKLASTPANLYSNNNKSVDENCTINIYQNRDKILSPIVETSKEYKSSSSSSFSSYSSIQKSRTFNK